MLTSLVQQHLQAIVTVLSLVNPLMCGALFARIEGGQSRNTQLADAAKAVLAVLVILVLAALFGTKVLHLFGVSLDAFSVAGGGVLSWIGFSMLSGNPTLDKPSSNDSAKAKRSLTPLILFAASPGTMTGVITLAVAHSRLEFPVTALVAIAVAVLVMGIVMVLVACVGRPANGGGFVRETVTRFMGLIVIAMGIQFALSGLRAFMETGPLA
jgi:multiple antibiotic resistance protein